MSWLTSLVDILFPPRITEILVRNAFDTDLRIVPVSIVGERATVISLMPYHNPLTQALLLEAKYHGSQKAWRILGTALQDYLLEYLADEAPFGTQQCVLVPLPLGTKRKQQRGYNQVEKVLRASFIESNAIVIDSERTRETKPQTKLPQQSRIKNVEGAFQVTMEVSPSVRYIVIDDVFTTGATMHSALGALKNAGAKNVSGIALAH
jgi:ComF family protein